MIRLAAPDIDDADVAAVAAVLRTGNLVQGQCVRAFEADITAVVGTRHAVALCNCTAALHLALLALNVGPGDHVAVTTYSWLSTANVVALCGATPVFVDVDARTFNMDPAALRRAAAEHALKAVLVVHTFGNMADMPAILDAAGGAPVIEDAACAIGAMLHGRPAGAWGVMGCFSFHPRKAVTTGEGGAVTTNDDALARSVRLLRNHGLDPDSPTPDFVAAGYNLRLTEFQAALGSAQFAKLERLVAARRRLARRYDELFADSEITVPVALAPEAHVYQSYVVLLPPDAKPRRDAIVADLRASGIEVTIGTYYMPMTRWFREHGGYHAGDFPVTEDIAGRAVSLPLHTQLGDDDQRRVARAVAAAL